MQEPKADATNIFDRRLWQRFWQIARLYWFSEEKWKARGLLFLALLLMFVFNAMNLLFSFADRDLTSALVEMNRHDFNHALLKYCGAFIVAIPIAVYRQYISDRLKICWERWLTSRFLDKYFRRRAYYHIADNSAIDNPDQRISGDVSSFTSTSTMYISTLFFHVNTFIISMGILWSISLKLVMIVLAYAVVGAIVSAFLGRPLINLNFQRQRREADFRYSLLQIRNNVESIAFYRGEARENSQIQGRLRELIANLRMLIGWERNLAFFTTGYHYIPIVLPCVVLIPLYFSGQIKFGVITQAGGAFTAILSSFDIIVTNLAMFSAFAAEVTRLETFDTALDQAAAGSTTANESHIVSREDSKLALDNVTLQTPDYQQILVRNVTVEVAPGRGLLVAGASGTGKSSLLRAIAGLWDAGEGQIFRPPLQEMVFLPQSPYMILGTLREQLLYPDFNRDASDGEISAVLEKVNLENLAERFGGFEAVMDWGHLLSPGEQQRLAFARLLCARHGYAVLDEATSALDVHNEARLYGQLQDSGITYVSVGHRPSLLAYHDTVLELQGAGCWRLVPAAEYSTTSAA